MSSLCVGYSPGGRRLLRDDTLHLAGSHGRKDKSPSATISGRDSSKQTVKLEQLAVLYARIALGAAFLSAVADRFGLWGTHAAWGDFATFTKYTAQVNSFLPAFLIPFVAWVATVAEVSIGIGLILGLWLRWMAMSAAALLFLFGTAMAISLGIKAPLDYSVFSASAGALLLAIYQVRNSEEDPTRR